MVRLEKLQRNPTNPKILPKFPKKSNNFQKSNFFSRKIQLFQNFICLNFFIQIFPIYDTTLGSRDIAMWRFLWRTCWRAGIRYSCSWIDIWMFWETLLESMRRMLVQLASFNANSLGRDRLRDVMQYNCIELTFWKRQQYIPEREVLERATDKWICFCFIVCWRSWLPVPSFDSNSLGPRTHPEIYKHYR